MKISVVDRLTQDQSDYLFHWREEVFPVEGKEIKWAKSQWHVLASERSDTPLAHLGYAGFTICLDGRSDESVVGVGGVVVRPEVQGQNIPAQLFEFLHNSEHACSLSRIFALLCPIRLQGYYQRHGYNTFQGSFSFLQNGVRTSTRKFVLMYYGNPMSASKIHINSEPW